MWGLTILENYTAKIRDVAKQGVLSPHDRYNAIFKLVREIHCNSMEEGFQECRQLVIEAVRKGKL